MCDIYFPSSSTLASTVPWLLRFGVERCGGSLPVGVRKDGFGTVTLGLRRSFVTPCGLVQKNKFMSRALQKFIVGTCKQFHFDDSQFIHNSFTVHSQFTHASKNTAHCPPCQKHQLLRNNWCGHKISWSSLLSIDKHESIIIYCRTFQWKPTKVSE